MNASASGMDVSQEKQSQQTPARSREQSLYLPAFLRRYLPDPAGSTQVSLEDWVGLKPSVKPGLQRIGFDQLGDFPVHRQSAWEVMKQLFADRKYPMILDVGGHEGETVRGFRKIFPYAGIISFEPTPDSYQLLKQKLTPDPLADAMQLAISHIDGKCSFHTYQESEVNSLLRLGHEGRTLHIDVPIHDIGRIEIDTMRLDTFLEHAHLDHIDILKLDVQGAERQVIEGAAKTLSEKRIDLLYTEVCFVPFYEGNSMMSDIVESLKPFGYELHSLHSIRHGMDGTPRFGDAIFLPKSEQGSRE